MALPNDDAQAYLANCAESGEEVDPARLVGMSREEILGEFYGSVTYLRMVTAGPTNSTPTR